MTYVDQLRPIVLAAGKMLLQHFRQPVTITHKADGSIQTNVDLLVEEFLKHELLKMIPQAGCIAEESEDHAFEREFTWVIDPLDGTRNFVKGLPYFAVSVTLYYQSEPVCAMTYAPALGEQFWATAEQGFWHNGHNVPAASNMWQQTGIFIVGSSKDARVVHFMQHALAQRYPDVRVKVCGTGSLALDLAYVATGMYEIALFSGPLKLWDVAAAMLFASERAGQKVVAGNKTWSERRASNLAIGSSSLVDLFIQK